MPEKNPPKNPPKKKYKDIDKYLSDFSSVASTTSTNKSPILSSAKIKQDVKKLENDEAAKKLLKSNPALGFKGKVPQQGKVDYPATDSRSSNYTGNPNMAFARAGKTGAAGKMAEDNFNIETLGAMLPLAGRTGRVGKAAIETSKKSGLLSNAHKLNPYAFKPNPEAYYRGIGEAGYTDALESGVLRTNRNPNWTSSPGDSPYFFSGKNFEGIKAYEPNVIAEVTNQPMRARTFSRLAGKGDESVFQPIRNTGQKFAGKDIVEKLPNIPLGENTKFLKKDWLQGYKEVPKPTTNFKSEINWSKWNKEIPSNKVLLNEYKAIEQQAKDNGSWMKYSDGSKFKGTPEQFVQMNHKNTIDFAGGDLKLSEQMYKEDLHRGSRQHIADFANRDLNDRTATFLTDSKKNAETYAGSDGLEKTYHHPDVNVHPGYDPTNKSLPLNYEDGIYQLGFPQNSKKVIAEANGNNWRFLDYNKKIDPDKFRAELNRSNFEHNLNDKIQHRFDYPEDFNINKDYLSTDDYATYIKNNNNPEGIVQINNVKDQMGRAEGIPSNTVYAVDANKVPIKSLRYNNGMFDITNPNIYKAVVPAAIGGTGLIQQAQGSVPKEQYATGGLINNNNNNMINKYKGDSHFDPSGGIGLSTAIVEDGELEYKGYFFSKDSEEKKKLEKEQALRAIRINKDDDYVWDKISRDSLNKAAIPLVESHEANRINKLMADLEMAEQGLAEAGIAPQEDMSLDPSQMDQLPIMAAGGLAPRITTNQQYDNNLGLDSPTLDTSGFNNRLASSSNFRPDARFSPGFKPSSDPSIVNPQRYSGNISGGKKGGSSKMSSGQLSGYANAIGGLASNLSQLGPEDPYYQGQTNKGVQTGQAVGNTITAAVPFGGLAMGLKDVSAAGKADMRSQDNKEGATAAAFAQGFSSPFGAIMDTADKYENDIYTGEQATFINGMNMLFPGTGSAIAEGEGWEQTAFENKKKKAEFQKYLDNRDFGGTEMVSAAPRDRQSMGYGGFKENKQIMATGGNKPKLNFNFKPSIMSPSSDPSVAYPYKYMPPTENTEMLSLFPESKPSYSVSEIVPGKNTTGPNTPMSMIGSSGNLPEDKKKVDWGNIAETAGMGLLSNAGNLAYLFDQGKDYDKVNYGSYTPEMVNTSSSRRAIRDSIATAREGLKESGRYGNASASMLATQGAKQYADAEERIRLTNTEMFNDAQLKNMNIRMTAMKDEAGNKGESLTNYYNALNALGQNTQAAGRGYNLRTSDAEKQRLVNENNARLKEWIASLT